MLSILWVNCAIIKALSEHSRTVNICNACRVRVEMRRLSSGLAYKSLLFDWWGSFCFRDVKSVSLVALLDLWYTLFNRNNGRLSISSNVLLLGWVVYDLWKNCFGPVVVLPTFWKYTLVMTTSTSVIGIASIVLRTLVHYLLVSHWLWRTLLLCNCLLFHGLLLLHGEFKLLGERWWW